jgi:hypothetical protein
MLCKQNDDDRDHEIGFQQWVGAPKVVVSYSNVDNSMNKYQRGCERSACMYEREE